MLALLVDDGLALRMMLSKTISSFGFDIIPAENGKRALELFDHATDRLYVSYH